MAETRLSASAAHSLLATPPAAFKSVRLDLRAQYARIRNANLWLSPPTIESAGSGTPLHFAEWKTFGRTKRNQPILVTEGALKADAAAYFLPDYFTLASGGVSCSHDLIVNLARGKSLLLAFDNDYQDDPAVLRQLARLIKLRLQTVIKQELRILRKCLDG